MALLTKSNVVAFKKETTSSELIDPSAGADFVPMRAGGAVTAAVENVVSDELINSLGRAKSFITKEVPTASFPKYLKHSGVEGQSPEYGILIESAMGSVDIQATERDVVSATAGDSTTAATITVDTGEGVEYLPGKAVLIKDGVNGYRIRNVKSVSGDVLTLNYNVSGAASAGVNLGRAVQYSPVVGGQPSYSMHVYQASVDSAYHQAMEGCRTTAMNINVPANGFAEMNFEIAGTGYYLNPINITASDIYLDFSDTTPTTFAAQVTPQQYKSPQELAKALETSMNSLGSVDNYTVTFDNTTGQYTFTSDGTTFQLLWNTGANTANTIGDKIGFNVASDDTGATSYTADNALTYDPPFTPAYDDSDNLVIKGAELVIGDFDEWTCRTATQASFSISTPKVDVPSICKANGIEESISLEREATLSATLILNKHDVGYFDRFINNESTSVMFNCGTKSGGSWVAGKCFNIYLTNASITSNVIADNEGYQVINLEASAHVTTGEEEVYINFL